MSGGAAPTTTKGLQDYPEHSLYGGPEEKGPKSYIEGKHDNHMPASIGRHQGPDRATGASKAEVHTKEYVNLGK